MRFRECIIWVVIVAVSVIAAIAITVDCFPTPAPEPAPIGEIDNLFEAPAVPATTPQSTS